MPLETRLISMAKRLLPYAVAEPPRSARFATEPTRPVDSNPLNVRFRSRVKGQPGNLYRSSGSVSFEVAHFQARRADKSTAGGVSHRYVNIRNFRPCGPTQGVMCRPFRPETQCFCSPVAHATGRRCAGLPALTKMRNLKKRQRGIEVLMQNPSLTFRIGIPHHHNI